MEHEYSGRVFSSDNKYSIIRLLNTNITNYLILCALRPEK